MTYVSLWKKGRYPCHFFNSDDEEVNVVMGLDMGADDYITKPFRIQGTHFTN